MGGKQAYADLAGRSQRAIAASRAWLSVGNRAIWALSALLVLFTCPLDMNAPTIGLDASWMAALNMAVDEGRNFGTEIVYTYGPLGFLPWRGLWFSWLAVLSYAYALTIYAAFVATLTWALERSVGLLAAAVVGFLYLTTSPSTEQFPLLLAVGWSFAALRRDRSPAAVNLLVVGAGLLCAIEPLVKLSVGPPTVVICLLGLAGARIGWRQWATFAAIAIGGFLAAWLLAGQALDTLWDYAETGYEIIVGYGEALAIDAGETWELLALVLFAVSIVVAANRGQFRDRRARWFATGLAAVAAYVLYKYATTQFAEGPIAVGLAAMLAIFLMVPRQRRQTVPFLAVAAVAGAIALHAYPGEPRLDVVANAKKLGESVELALRPGLREQHIDQARAQMQAELAMTPPVLAALQGRTVAVEPWESGIVWAYELGWHPFPIFQSYQAYTAKLDRLNAATIEDPNGPEVLLRTMPAGNVRFGGRPNFGGRQPYWDQPEQNRAALCNFVPTLTEGTWQVLSRVPDRCGEPELIESRSAEPDEVVPVPQAGRDEFVFLRLDGAELEGIEKLWSIFARPEQRWVSINRGRHGARLVPGTSGDGLIVSVDRSIDGGVGFVELPVIRNMAVEGAGGPLQYDFYRVPIESAGPGAQF